MSASRRLTGRCLNLSASMLLSAAVLSACSSTQEISRQQMMAPENLELAMRGDVAVVEFTGEGGQDVADRLSASLERVRLQGQPVFDVHGPVRMHSGRTTAIGNVDPAEARDYARSVGAEALLMGQTSYDTNTELLPPQTSETCKSRDSAGACLSTMIEVTQCAEITVTMDFAAQGLDVETGETIYNPRPGRASRSTTECVSTGENPALLITRLMNNDYGRSVDRLRTQLAQNAADRIHRDISPYPETFQVSFLREGDNLPQAQEAMFEQASDLVGDGQPGAACSVWQRMAQSGVRDPAVSYNLAACAEDAGNFQAAMEAYEAVYRMVFHTPLQSTGQETAEANYELNDWAELLSEARARVRRRHDARETLNTLAGPPSM